MANDHTKKTVRNFQCRDYLYEIFEEMGVDLDCSVDYLINEAMRQYAKSRNYGGKSIAGRASIPPSASAADAGMRESFMPESTATPSAEGPSSAASRGSIPPGLGAGGIGSDGITEAHRIEEGRPTPPSQVAASMLEGADLTPPPTALPTSRAASVPAPAMPAVPVMPAMPAMPAVPVMPVMPAVPAAASVTPPALPPVPASDAGAAAPRRAEPAPSFGLPPMSAAHSPAPAPLPVPRPAALPSLGGPAAAPALPSLGAPMAPALPPLGAPMAAPALPPLPAAALPQLPPALPPLPLPPAPPALNAPPALPPAPPVAPPVASRQALFVIFNGQKMPVTITNDEFIIGRSSKTADLAIKDGNISRRHAAVVYHGGAYYMKDLGSTNGVDFQGQKVGTKRIDEGDVFTVCEYEVRFTYH